MKHLRTLCVAGIISVGVWAAAGSSAHAAGAGAVSYTQTDHNATQTNSPDYNPCSGAIGTTYLTFNDVFHVTMLANGTDWVTGTLTGSFMFVPDDSYQPTYSGHFTEWFNENDNLRNGNETFTFSVHGTGSDGSTITFQEVAHMGVSATGVVVSFDKASCG